MTCLALVAKKLYNSKVMVYRFLEKNDSNLMFLTRGSLGSMQYTCQFLPDYASLSLRDLT
jgi:hypothetical protein